MRVEMHGMTVGLMRVEMHGITIYIYATAEELKDAAATVEGAGSVTFDAQDVILGNNVKLVFAKED